MITFSKKRRQMKRRFRTREVLDPLLKTREDLHAQLRRLRFFFFRCCCCCCCCCCCLECRVISPIRRVILHDRHVVITHSVFLLLLLLRKRHSFFELSLCSVLCLSRACLGETMIYIYIYGAKVAFLYLEVLGKQVSPAENESLFECFPYVGPEPVLAT
jgi:hypothetical protein